MADDAIFEGWAVLELMGHRRLGGYLQEVTIAGGAFIRIDVPGDTDDSDPVATQLYSPSAVYCISPTTEELARAVASRNQPAPVHRWELPAPKTEPVDADIVADHEDGLDDFDEDEDEDEF